MKLIMTADDFGLSREINAAVIEAHRRGVLTAASLMVAGDAADEAVDLARQLPGLAVGLHIVLVDGKAVLPSSRIPRLVNARGWFANAPGRLGLAYVFDARAREQMQLELEAQFARFAETGLKLAHVDGHQHMHLHPAVCPRVIELAQRYGAGGIRSPHGEVCFSLLHDRRNWGTKLWRSAQLSLLSMRCRRLARRRGLAVADAVYGLMRSGTMDETYVLALLRRSRGASAEIYFHPTTGSRLCALGPNPGELQTLLSVAVRDLIRERGMQRCSYRDLTEAQP